MKSNSAYSLILLLIAGLTQGCGKKSSDSASSEDVLPSSAAIPVVTQLKNDWIITGKIALIQKEAAAICHDLGKVLPSEAFYKNSQQSGDGDIANKYGTTLQQLFSIPSQLHWLNDSACTNGQHAKCSFYRPAADVVDHFKNDSAGNGNDGYGAYVLCVNSKSNNKAYDLLLATGQ